MIQGRLTITKYRNGVKLETRTYKNVVRSRLVDYITSYIWYRLAESTGFCKYYTGCTVVQDIVHPLRLCIADVDKLTIKSLDAGGLTRTTNETAGQHIVRITWTDGSTDSYDIYYLGLFLMTDSLTPGQNNITGNPGAMLAVRLDPPMTKASGDTLTFIWDIIFPFGEIT